MALPSSFNITSAPRPGQLQFTEQPLVLDEQTTTGIEPGEVKVIRNSQERNINGHHACHFEAAGVLFVKNAVLSKIQALPHIAKNWPQAEQIFTGVEYQRIVSETTMSENGESSFVLHQATGDGDDDMQYALEVKTLQVPHGYVFKQQLKPDALKNSHLTGDGDPIEAAKDVLKTSNGKIDILLTELRYRKQLIPGALIFIQFESDVLKESPTTGETIIAYECETAVGNGPFGALPGTVADHIEERLENIAELISE